MTIARPRYLICLPVTVLMWITLAWGQSQAPVVWGEGRWIGVGCLDRSQPVVPFGDTLIFAGRMTSPQYLDSITPVVAYSHDNGQTTSDWMRLDSIYYYTSEIMITASNQGVFAFRHDGFPINTSTHWTLVQRSMDGGQSWSVVVPRQVRWMGCGFAVADQVLQITQTQTNWFAAISNDGGDQWTTDIPLGPNDVSVYYRYLIATRNHLILLGGRSIDRIGHVFAATSDRNGLLWTPFVELPEQPFVHQQLGRTIAGDTTSETAVVVMSTSDWGYAPIDLYMYRTTDGGESWELPRPLTEGAPLYYLAYPVIFNRGPLFGVAYQDIHNPDTTQTGLYWRFSANHGKDWYPPQRADTYYNRVITTSGQFVGNEVRLYSNGVSPERYDYRTVSGILSEDTIRPALTGFHVTSNTIRANDTLLFTAMASDNDTLSEVKVLLADTSGNLYSVILTNEGGGQFRGVWMVPAAESYSYYFTAEDFWENSIAYPDSEVWHFVALPEISAVEHAPAELPGRFSLSVSPNPFNATTRITFTLPQPGMVSLAIYDVSGRLVRSGIGQTQGSPLQAGVHHLEFDASDLPSGIYFARLTVAGWSQTQKMVLLK